jgi:hypothetical protein
VLEVSQECTTVRGMRHGCKHAGDDSSSEAMLARLSA